MSRLIRLKTHPFRLLLYVEWTLLGLAVLNELPWDGIPYLETLLGESPVSSKLIPFSSLLTVLCIGAFGLMGLRLPTGKTIDKLLYTALELGLIWPAVALGGWQASFASLHMIVVIRGCLMFKASGRLFIAGLVFISFLLTLLISDHYTDVIQYQLARLERVDPARIAWLATINSVIFFGLFLVFVLLLVNALLSERQSRQQLALAHDQLRRYALRIEDQATLQERNRIAREIHDSLGHALTAQSIQLENALLFCKSDTEKTRAFLTEARQLGATALREIRQSVSALRSEPLQGRSLESAIADLAQDFRRTTNITPDCTICLSCPVTAEVSTAIYRIAQEALTNISKHGVATRVTLQLRIKAGWIHLLVEDNGRGFNPKQNTTGFGLQGMRERALGLGGYFKIASEPGAGCRVNVDIPLAKLLP